MHSWHHSWHRRDNSPTTHRTGGVQHTTNHTATTKNLPSPSNFHPITTTQRILYSTSQPYPRLFHPLPISVSPTPTPVHSPIVASVATRHCTTHTHNFCQVSPLLMSAPVLTIYKKIFASRTTIYELFHPVWFTILGVNHANQSAHGANQELSITRTSQCKSRERGTTTRDEILIMKQPPPQSSNMCSISPPPFLALERVQVVSSKTTRRQGVPCLPQPSQPSLCRPETTTRVKQDSRLSWELSSHPEMGRGIKRDYWGGVLRSHGKERISVEQDRNIGSPLELTENGPHSRRAC